MALALKRLVRAAALVAALSAPPAVAAGTSLPAVKAAFLFNFIKLVDWPKERFAGDSAPLRICVLREDEMLHALRTSISGKLAGTHPIEIAEVFGDENLAVCHVLFLGDEAAERYVVLMKRVANKGVLVVDEGSQFTLPDGMIRLFLEQSRVRFELNLGAMERGGLRVDPRLVRLARLVGG